MVRLIIFFIISMVAIGGISMADNLSTCSVDTVPIQIFDTGWHSDVTTLSALGSPSGIPAFNTFVATVTEHIATKLAQEKLCLNSTESKERSLVQFVHMHIANPAANPSLPPAGSSGVCRITSPWIDIAIERELVPSVRAIVRFNERQLLADQAVMAGAQNVPPGVAMPLTSEEFRMYVARFRTH